MEPNEILNSSWVNGYFISETPVRSLPYFITAFLAFLLFYSFHGPKPNAPLVNPKRLFELTQTRPKRDFVQGSREMLRNWFRANPNKPVRVITDFGELTVLPPRLANEIRNDERLSFSRWTFKAFHAHLPGFEGFREGSRDSHVVQSVIMRDLTKYLNKVTEPLAEETALTLPALFTDNKDWHTIPLRETILRLIARISSRVFLGDEVCRNEAWLKITREYTVTGFTAAEQLRMWPCPTRWIVNWFLPSCRKARAQVREARQIIRPVLEKRRKQKNALAAEGRDAVQFDDAIEWFEQASKGNYYDPAISQLILSLAAIHTTSDLTCQTMLHLAQNPEMLEPLRKEIVAVLSESGWKKTSLYNMKLLDSVIKESQRLKPIGLTQMRRIALEDVKLSDGTVVPKGNMLAVSAHKLWDPEIYKNPQKWDGYRFYEMRKQAGNENIAQLVSTGPENLAFGHGKHACPGRFFAANEVKIAMIYILLKYDWKLPKGAVPKIRSFGNSLGFDPVLKMEIRRRQEEIEL